MKLLKSHVYELKSVPGDYMKLVRSHQGKHCLLKYGIFLTLYRLPPVLFYSFDVQYRHIVEDI